MPEMSQEQVLDVEPFRSLGMEREPFSTSPDPRFLFLSPSHQITLKRLEAMLKLRRGLNIIYGDVGTGKTTVSRALIQTLSADPAFSFHIMLDPHAGSEFQFLASLVSTFGLQPGGRSTVMYKMAINDFLFHAGTKEGKIPVLIVDEGQELAPSSIETLRVLLNYETNEFKLLQLIIFAQLELLAKIEKMPNFQDRVCFRYALRPLTPEETGEMINFRLKVAGYNSDLPVFTQGAVERIFSATGGYPRKIIMLCHDAIELVAMDGKKQVDDVVLDQLLVSPIHDLSAM
jgi:general secretion pathway protein A